MENIEMEKDTLLLLILLFVDNKNKKKKNNNNNKRLAPCKQPCVYSFVRAHTEANTQGETLRG